jgi:hypothetical protein
MGTLAKQVDFLLNGYRDPTTDVILGGGKVTTKLAGTSTESALWTDREKTSQATNPIILGSDGTAEVYGDGVYDFVITESDDTPVDTISGIDYRVDSNSFASLADLRGATGTEDGQAALTSYRTTLGDKGGGHWYWDSSDLSTQVTEDTESGVYAAPDSDPTGSSGAWIRQYEYALDVAWFGASPSASGAENATAFIATIAFLTTAFTNIVIGQGVFVIDSTLHITLDNIKIVGNGRREGKTRLDYQGSGALFQLDEDDGGDWDANTYDGVDGFTLKDMELYANGVETPLLSANVSPPGRGYIAGSYGIQDWRGGSVKLDNVTFTGWEWGFWGIQSDINLFNNILLTNNKTGCFFGPRSDQLTFNDCYSFRNDTAMHFDGASSASVNFWVTVKDGSGSTYPLLVKGSTVETSESLVFRDCWFEHFGSDLTLRAFAQIEINTTVNSKNITFINPSCHLNTLAAEPNSHVEHFIEIGSVDGIFVINPSGLVKNFDTFWSHSSTGTGYGFASGMDGDDLSTITNQSSGEGTITIEPTGTGKPLETRSRTGRIIARTLPSKANPLQADADEKSFQLEPITGGGLRVVRPDADTDNKTLLTLPRRVDYGSASPADAGTPLTWDQGDRRYNDEPTVGQPKSWVCTVSGTPGTWVSEGNL